MNSSRDVYYNPDCFEGALSEIKNINSNMSKAKGYCETYNNECASLESFNTGYKISKTLTYQNDIEEFESKFTDIEDNLVQVKCVGDLLNNDSNSLMNLFDSKTDLLNYIKQIAAGNVDVFGSDSKIPFLVDYSNIIKDGYTVQGYTIIDQSKNKNGNNKVLITAYKKGENSRLYFYDKTTGKLDSTVILTNSDHVGGATFDSENQILWVTGSDGKVHSYDYDAMSNAIFKSNSKVVNLNDSAYSNYNIEIPNNICTATKDSDLGTGFTESVIIGSVSDLILPGSSIITGPLSGVAGSMDNQNGMDSIYFHNGKLYSCSYSGKGHLFSSDISVNRDSSGKITSISDNTTYLQELNGACQGMAFYEENGKTYMVTASSILKGNSRLTRWEETDEGLEGIDIRDGQVTGIFETGTSAMENFGSVDDINEPSDAATDALLSAGGQGWDEIHGTFNN